MLEPFAALLPVDQRVPNPAGGRPHFSGGVAMRFSILVVVLALMVVPAMAQNYLGPIPGVYKTQFGQMMEGVFSESWVDAPYHDGVVHNTIHALGKREP